MLMDYRLFHLLHYRLSGGRISAVRTGVREIDCITVGADFLCLPGFNTVVRAKTTVKVIAAVFADMQEYSRAARGAMLYIVFNLGAAELTSFQFSVLQ